MPAANIESDWQSFWRLSLSQKTAYVEFPSERTFSCLLLLPPLLKIVGLVFVGVSDILSLMTHDDD